MFERERLLMREGQRERERERIPSRLLPVSVQPDMALISQTVRSRPEPKSRV